MPAPAPGQAPLSPSLFRLAALFLAFCLLYALGTNTPLYAWLYRALPGVTLFRRPVDAMFVATICLAPIAALGLEGLLAAIRAHGPRKRAILLAAAILPTFALCLDLTQHTLKPNRANHWDAALVSALPDRFQAADFLRAATRNPGQPDWRVEFNQPAPFWPDLPDVLHLYATQGYDPLQEARYVTVFGDTASGYSPVVFAQDMPGYTAPLFALLGVKYIASTVGTDADALARKAGLKLAFASDAMNIWETDNRLPRLFSPASAVAATAAEAPAMAAATPDLGKTVVIEGSGEAAKACGPAPLAAIQLGKYRNTSATMIVTSGASPGWLVMTDPASMGWHAAIDGKEVPLYRADGYFRAICVPRGTHAVAFRFEPFREIGKRLLHLPIR